MQARKLTCAALAFGAGLAFVTAAQAATMEECQAGIEEVNTLIGSKEGVPEGTRGEARDLSQQASNANDTGDYDRCMELVNQAKEALGSNR